MGAASSCSHQHLLWLLGGAKKKPVDMVGVTMKSPSLPGEVGECQVIAPLCYSVAEELKLSSKADQRLKSHRHTHYAVPVLPTSHLE